MSQNSSSVGKALQVAKIINAPRMAVYNACVDPTLLVRWRAPNDMQATIHAFDAREGGAYRMSLTYRNPAQSAAGKSSGNTDTFQGRFIQLVPGEKIVKVVQFESAEAKFAGEMTITTCFADTDGGTEVTMLFENIPSGIRPEDNEEGTRQALARLWTLFENASSCCAG